MSGWVAGALICLYGLAVATGGWDNWFAASVLSGITLAGLLVVMVSRTERDALAAAPPWAIGALFACAWIVAAAQLFAPGGRDLWSMAPGASALATVDPYATSAELGKLLGLGAGFLVGFLAGRDARTTTRLLAVFLAASVAMVLAGSLLAAAYGSSARQSFGLGNVNVSASVMGLAALAAAAWIFRVAKRSGAASLSYHLSRAGLAWVALAITVAGVVLTGSRAGFVALLVGSAAFASMELLAGDRESRPVAAAAAGGFFATLTAVALVSGRALWPRLAAVGDFAELDRLRMVMAHLPILAAAPWRGHGLGSYEVVNAVYADPRTAEALLTAGALHNVYVQLLEEGGVLTALPIFAAVGLALATIARARLSRRTGRTWLSFGIAASVLVGVHAAMEYTLNVYAVAALCALGLGLLTAAAREPRRAA